MSEEERKKEVRRFMKWAACVLGGLIFWGVLFHLVSTLN